MQKTTKYDLLLWVHMSAIDEYWLISVLNHAMIIFTIKNK